MQPGFDQPMTMPGLPLGLVGDQFAMPPVVTAPRAAINEARDHARQANLDQRLTAVLRGMVRGLACDGADFYVLNDPTNELVLRAHHQEDGREPGDKRRTLMGASADVAALAGNALVLEDDLDVATWAVPVWCGAAICLPVASDETIYGTLWIYCREPRSFTNAEVELVEIVAGRLAVELELNKWRSGASANLATPAAEPTATPIVVKQPASSRIARPMSHPQLDDWELAGLAFTGERVQSFYDWQTLADGRTLVVAGSMNTNEQLTDGLLEAARIALRSHAQHAGEAGELLSAANHTLWLASPGGEGLSMAVAMLAADGTHATVALAGNAGFAMWSGSSSDWTATTCPAMGWCENTNYASRYVELMVRERLVLATTNEVPPVARFNGRLACKLREPSAAELRMLPGKRALRLFADAMRSGGAEPAGMALVRRR
jgi:putative methionine-R-sulfoxide reductase with GAF domain